MTKLVLIDGNAIIHRAYHALPLLTNSKGEPTNAVYGFVAMLLRVIEEFKPTHIAVAFDMPGPTFRNEIFAAYQAQRPAMEDELVSQIDKIHKVVKAMNIPIYEIRGYEADDVLATIAQQVKSSNFKVQDTEIEEVIIVTGDRDLLQLVNHKVKLFMPVKGINEGKLYDETAAQERMGVKPRQIVDLKALMGDTSDNYPGIAGIGPKTAASLLAKYGSLDNIYQHLNQIRVGIAKKLREGKADVLLAQKLAKVVTDAPLKFNLSQAKLGDLMTDEVIKVFGELGFKTLLKRLSKMSRQVGDQALKSPNHKTQVKKDTRQQMELFKNG